MLPKVIIPLQPKSIADATRKIRSAEKDADLIEIWLDGIKNLTSQKVHIIVQTSKKPLILNLKDAVEHGSFTGTAKERFLLLSGSGAKFVDLPLNFPPRLIHKFREKNPFTKLILSWHDFVKMPNSQRLRTLANRAERLNADVIKLVGTAKNYHDILPIIQISRELAGAQKSFLTMAMGEAGELTRILTPLLGGMGMFAVRNKKLQTAPGQLTIAELKKWWQIFS